MCKRISPVIGRVTWWTMDSLKLSWELDVFDFRVSRIFRIYSYDIVKGCNFRCYTEGNHEPIVRIWNITIRILYFKRFRGTVIEYSWMPSLTQSYVVNRYHKQIIAIITIHSKYLCRNLAHYQPLSHKIFGSTNVC